MGNHGGVCEGGYAGKYVGQSRGIIHLFIVILFTLLFFLFVILLLCSLDNGGCDSIQVALTILANPPATVFGLLEDTDLLQGLANFALDGSGCIGVV